MDAFAKNRERPQGGNDDDDNENDDNGAGNQRKRLRKRLVEKTTMDDKIYLHTDTVSVWEEINDPIDRDHKERVDEEMGTSTSESQAKGRGENDSKKRPEPSTKITPAPPPPRRNTRKGTNTNVIKQQGLMSFFSSFAVKKG